MMAGHLLTGQRPRRRRPAGIEPMLVSSSAASPPWRCSRRVLITQPRGDPLLLYALWFGFACAAPAGPVAYAVLAQRFPPELTGRVPPR